MDKSEHMERIRPGEGHSHTEDGIGRNKSGQRKNPTQRGALTSWRRHRERQVRTQKESDPVRGTHSLETASGGISQDIERIRPSEGHSHPGDGIGMGKSGHGKDWTERGYSHTGDGVTREMSKRRKNPTERGALTYWRRRQEGQVSTRKGSDQARGTHLLETASGGTTQDIERI